MSKLDTWLCDNFQISRSDLTINMNRLIQNASRYSKEHTLPPDHLELDFLTGGEDAVAKFVDDWLGEHKRSSQEDARGIYREGENMQIANAIVEARKALQPIGGTALLNDFPFKAIPIQVQCFFCQALQKEVASSLMRIGKVTLLQSCII